MTDSTPTALVADRVLLRPSEAAALMGICQRTLWTLTQTEGLQSVRLGKAVRYRPEALKEWAEAREKGGAGR
jgi:excisionase family DNA binding protein